MTEPLKESLVHISDEQLLEEYIAEKQETFDRFLYSMFEQKEIDEFTYKRLSAEELPKDSFHDFIDSLNKLISEMLEVSQRNKLNQILKGAEFIESIEKSDSRYDLAMKKYDSLCDDYRGLKARIEKGFREESQ